MNSDNTSNGFPPLQLKGEIMDLEFTIDTDHRKRRRNRTTQSCLNCHTSKRKCDRKRPCQRCIQLGLTGLCVYEIDDPALRDDPTVDENTRLRNRIAELESLVRELRGKPHPRWADSNFRDGDPNEKWHSRATKCAPLKRRASPELSPSSTSPQQIHNGHGHPPSLLPPIKTEPLPAPHPSLYRFSASPASPSRYPPASSLEHDGSDRYGYEYGNGGGSDDGAYGGHYSPSSAGGSGREIAARGGSGGQRDGYCPCRASPAMAHPYIQLSQALQSALAAARQYAQHPPGTHCVLFRRVADLASLMQGTDPTDPGGPGYDSSTPTDSEVLTPLSASASTGSFHGSPGAFHAVIHGHATNGSGPGSPGAFHPASPAPAHAHEWVGYNPYFPLAPSGEHGIYGGHVIT
ncbi:hypothetical protein DFH07DRAFT_69054 [Mycena maculata]|uniref:Zn(2)-C6 fungal-type domain-containing protein n=1 Tax=Mycena maculata TaxID=230809 RepID=A0AAD7ICW2_9AGAR|nr:hypothetical protein DFH07DRAFT_69054 [Mycena maculata]